MRLLLRLGSALLVLALSSTGAAAQRQGAPVDSARLAALKDEIAREIEGMHEFTQQMVDQVFSYGELGFQESESSRYLVGILRRNGFTVQEGIAGIPTAWMASWGSGKPVIALGSDLDGIPQASQKPGVAYHSPLVEGAPGHGEGHNSGLPVVITAAIATKKVMQRERIAGTIRIWPGVAEELVAAKAWFVREGFFRDVDVTIFTHVGSNLNVSYGPSDGTGLVSVLYRFQGETAHSAGAPWRGRSALDAVELMNAGWNYRREHLRLPHRSHYVITEGGDQPNVVPRTAAVWYYFREVEYPRIRELWEIGNQIAQGATLMTGTTLDTVQVLGAAWPRHFNRPVAMAMYDNIRRVGLPRWDEADQALARALQRELGNEKTPGLDTALAKIDSGVPPEQNRGGGSDDIGDISWVVPTITLRYPANIPNLPGHHWSNAVSMATPIAHKGSTAGAKATAMTLLDLFTRPELVDSAWSYFRDVQTRDIKYEPLIRPGDQPPVEMNAQTMQRYRPQMRRYYYDSRRYRTYLEQLGITYPTVRAPEPQQD
ncbi:peptidase dimerization domain-containing protein [Longimicrobium sp.]|jgi:aminobenzoyl-glutamate utilization protein B|uniref:peptidase dimerization domain-containing protein n=1 Tax=Longimicrobium sp. TaxID=2029185 RepID=UPI002ED94A1B